STRKDMGDEAGAKRELEASRVYYEGLLSQAPLDPRLEAQVRLHLVHSFLDLGRKTDALAALDAAETAVVKEPSLASSIPEIRYTRIKLTGLEAKDPSAPVAALERIAFDFPQSQVAPLALFDAAFLLERSGQLDRARAGYESVAARYPREAETAASALLRQAVLEDRLGAWDQAKSILESIPTKYPFTSAAAQAPMTAAEHYVKQHDTAGTKAALRRGVEIYQRMIAADSLGAGTPRLRWNLIRCYASLNDTPGTFRAVDAMVATSPTSNYAAMALLGGAKLAEDKKMRPKAAAYLNRFLQEFPNSPEADRVRARLRELAK
ncbi:MAG TPA: tetratricopeptide repeat protein, partial [Candidatus Eisenbacteria bacterium]|nr:tetratricopeptide repeat protein [Candidatus Eisenbacteria bacterium]